MKPTYDQLLEENASLRIQLLSALECIKRLEARVAQLEAQIGKNSKNSSKSPSTDQKSNIPPKKRKEERPFHKGASRQLFPEDWITSREVRRMEICPRCRSQMELTGEVRSWQQIDFPEIRPLVHQIDLAVSRCPKCQLKKAPSCANHETFLLGPRLEGLIHLCLSQFRMSHQSLREFLSQLVPGLVISQGLVSKIKSRGASILSSFQDQIRAQILASRRAIHIDATSWRHCGRNEHTVVVRTGNWVLFEMIERQNGEEMAKVIEDRRLSHLVTDRGLSSGKISSRLHQYCLAHLLRNIRGKAEHPSSDVGDTAGLGRVYDLIQRLFFERDRLIRGEVSESTWRQYGYSDWSEIELELEDLLEGTKSKEVRRFCRRLLKDLPRFRVYLRNRDHPMTNNPAEEALRPLVIARKLCFGSQSEYGNAWRSAIQSWVETFRKQGRAGWVFLADIIRANRRGLPSPVL